jgi:hypothetical protein
MQFVGSGGSSGSCKSGLCKRLNIGRTTSERSVRSAPLGYRHRRLETMVAAPSTRRQALVLPQLMA